jgi:hypothetical protein
MQNCCGMHVMKRPLGRPKRGWDSNVRMYVREINVRMRTGRTTSGSCPLAAFGISAVESYDFATLALFNFVVQ